MITIYTDEAGNLGFNFTKSGTSKKFVITVLLCNRNADKAIHKAVKRTKNKINYKTTAKHKKHELKGTQTTVKVKDYFYDRIKDCPDWKLYALVLDKTSLLPLTDIKLPQFLYEQLIMELISHLELKNNQTINIIFDRCKRSDEIVTFDQKLIQHLRRFVPTHIPIYINHDRSIDNAGLQAADLFA